MKLMAAPTLHQPPRWAPDSLRVVDSAYGASPLRSILGAWRGEREPVEGQALTAAQLTLLAPHLAASFEQPAAAVEDALRAVRFYIGGPPQAFGMTATVLSDRVYLKDEAALERIMSWSGRRLLAHELAHVMQRIDSSDRLVALLGGGERGRDRAALTRYAAAAPGAAVRGTLEWLAERIPGSDRTRSSISDLVHDAHRLEREAEQVAIAFRDATAGMSVDA